MRASQRTIPTSRPWLTADSQKAQPKPKEIPVVQEQLELGPDFVEVTPQN
jgi:hypothetical protein